MHERFQIEHPAVHGFSKHFRCCGRIPGIECAEHVHAGIQPALEEIQAGGKRCLVFRRHACIEFAGVFHQDGHPQLSGVIECVGFFFCRGGLSHFQFQTAGDEVMGPADCLCDMVSAGNDFYGFSAEGGSFSAHGEHRDAALQDAVGPLGRCMMDGIAQVKAALPELLHAEGIRFFCAELPGDHGMPGVKLLGEERLFNPEERSGLRRYVSGEGIIACADRLFPECNGFYDGQIACNGFKGVVLQAEDEIILGSAASVSGEDAAAGVGRSGLWRWCCARCFRPLALVLRQVLPVWADLPFQPVPSGS